MIYPILKQASLTCRWRQISFFIFAPLALWSLLWLSLFNLDVFIKLFDPGNTGKAILVGSREIFPLVSLGCAIIIITIKASREPQKRYLMFGPLGLAAGYGAVGILASVQSPNETSALYWALAYISVPLVIWALVWETNSHNQLGLLINYNWLLLSVAIFLLFVFALWELDLGNLILSPASWFRCELNAAFNGQSWYNLTGGALRPTGVGRYGAIAALVALSILLRGRWRFFWGIIFFMALCLLITSGARTSYIGFAGGALLILFLLGNKQVALAGIIAITAILPVLWATGSLSTFSGKCLFRTWAIGAPYTPPGQEPSLSLALTSETDEGQENNITSGIYLEPTPEASSATTTKSIPSKTVSGSKNGNDTLSSIGTPVGVKPSAGTPTTTKSLGSGTAPDSSDGDNDPTSITTSIKITPVPDTLTNSKPLPLRTSLNETDKAPPITTTEKQTDQKATLNNPTDSKTDSIVRNPPQKPSVATTTDSDLPIDPILKEPGENVIPRGFFEFTGRTSVWAAGLDLILESPFIGWGFHADRYLLGSHMHNAPINALLQTGILGALLLFTSIILGWYLMFKAVLVFAQISTSQQILVAQSGGLLIFMSIRAIFESSGSFYGVDWLFLCPTLLYLQIINRTQTSKFEAP